MRALAFLAAAALAAAAVAFAAIGAFLTIWVPFSSDPPDTATAVLIGFGCALFAPALACAWAARRMFHAGS